MCGQVAGVRGGGVEGKDNRKETVNTLKHSCKANITDKAIVHRL